VIREGVAASAILLFILLAALPAAAAADPLHGGRAAVLYFVEIPLTGGSRAERQPVFGLAILGRRASETVRVDSRLVRLIETEAIDAKWLLVGGVAAGVALLAAQSASTSGSRTGTDERPPATCPKPPEC
jgi:hypothetical protein